MRKYCIGIIMVLLFVFNVSAFAVNYNLGASVQYVWWTAGFKDEMSGEKNNPFVEGTGVEQIVTDQKFNDSDGKGEFMLGPIASISYSERLSLAATFLVSQDYSFTSTYYSAPVTNPSTGFIVDFSYDIRLYDSDVMLNYRLDNIFKVFVGMKYFKHDADGIFYYYNEYDGSSSIAKLESDGHDIGSGVGFSANYRIMGSLFFIASASGVYIWTFGKRKTTDGSGEITEEEDKGYKYGPKLMASFAYYVSSLKMTILLGGRYRVYFDDKPDREDIFYGYTCSVLFAF